MNTYEKIRTVLMHSQLSLATWIGAEALAALAELERSVTERDTEIARLETDLELARIGAERYRWLRDQGGRDVDTPWVVFRGGTWFLRAELDAAIDAARGAG